ncbi:MAG: magnesium transporter [Pirellulaceae bacterium]|nr:magnesium transporter [Pirellulaceae bacterium]
MINTLYLPELREMLAEHNSLELREFCMALHPGRTAEFMEGLSAHEAFEVLQFAAPTLRAEIFSYFDETAQMSILLEEDDKQVAELITSLPADDAVDLLSELPDDRVEHLLALIPAPDRRDIRRLQNFAEGTAGALMTTEAACLDERLTVREALEKLSRQAEQLETIYYIYVVDDTNHLKGVVSTRKLVSSIGKSSIRITELMETDLIVARASDDQQTVTQKVAKFNLLAIPVVDSDGHMLGIITHDDVIDVVMEEATEDAQRIAAVDPLEDSYLRTGILTLSWKRGIWLGILFFPGMFTVISLKHYEGELEKFVWLTWFLPLIMGCGGNSGSQSATLIITSMAMGDVRVSDWFKIMIRELSTGLLLGSGLGLIGMIPALLFAPTVLAALIIPLTILLVVTCGTLTGSLLPMFFQRSGWDPALMSNPFVAGINDICAILLYVNVARWLL